MKLRGKLRDSGGSDTLTDAMTALDELETGHITQFFYNLIQMCIELLAMRPWPRGTDKSVRYARAVTVLVDEQHNVRHNFEQECDVTRSHLTRSGSTALVIP